jgi:hypothetical protein
MAALASGALEATLQPQPLPLQSPEACVQAPPFGHLPWVADLHTYDLELLGVLHHAALSVGLPLRPPTKRRKYSTLMSEGAGGPAATAAAAAEGVCS